MEKKYNINGDQESNHGGKQQMEAEQSNQPLHTIEGDGVVYEIFSAPNNEKEVSLYETIARALLNDIKQ